MLSHFLTEAIANNHELSNTFLFEFVPSLLPIAFVVPLSISKYVHVDLSTSAVACRPIPENGKFKAAIAVILSTSISFSF